MIDLDSHLIKSYDFEIKYEMNFDWVGRVLKYGQYSD